LSSALSTVLENTAFLGDIVLRLPDIAHELLYNNDDWKLLIQWAIDFTNDTHIFVGKDQQLISMVGYPTCMLIFWWVCVCVCVYICVCIYNISLCPHCQILFLPE